jgi:shikimate kinase
MNAVLIGFRGTGKSSIAELVALCTDRSVYRMDDEIVKRAGCAIPDFVKEHGWDAFWELESEVAQEAAALNDAVIDTGGGVVQRPDNVAQLKATGPVFWLTAHVDTIRERIKEETHRPSITGKKSFLDEVAEVLEARLPMYEDAADHIIETDGRTLGEIADEVVAILCG